MEDEGVAHDSWASIGTGQLYHPRLQALGASSWRLVVITNSAV